MDAKTWSATVDEVVAADKATRVVGGCGREPVAALGLLVKRAQAEREARRAVATERRFNE